MRREVRPNLREVLVFRVDVVQLTGPACEDMETLSVVEPARSSLVQASAPCDAVAGFVFDDARFLVEDAICGHRLAVLVTRDRYLYLKDALRHHPGKQFQGTSLAVVAGLQRKSANPLLDCVVQLLALFNRVNLFLVECAANHQAHASVVANHAFDAAGRKRKCRGSEVAR